MASSVMTVTGPVDASDLGRTLVHEHVRIQYPGDQLDPRRSWDRAAAVAESTERLAALRDHGVRTFVDPCPIELGRDPELMAEVAERSGVHVVCATGFYHEHDGIGIPYYWRARRAEEVAELYLHEIEHGIGATGIRPGVIKIASADPPGHHDRKVIAGAAIAARESGLGIVSHCESSVGGDVQQEILAEHGVDLGRVLIGHQDQETELANLRAIVERGSFVGIDRIGIAVLAPDERRADHVAALVAAGHADRICLSQDRSCTCTSARFPYVLPDASPPELADQLYEPFMDAMTGTPHTYLLTDFVPMLTDRGVGDDVIERILVDNPRRLLAGA